MRKLKNHLNQVINSLKMREIEERYDIYFSRFLGLFIAKAARRINLTPTQVTMMSMLSGMIGGGLLLFQNNVLVIVVASLFITIAGLLDSADGQLARLTGQATEFGRILDGTVDSVVFVSCYIGATSFFVFGENGNVLYVPLAMAAGYLHMMKSAIYDFYKNQMLLYYGNFEENRAESVVRLTQQMKSRRGIVKLIYFFYLGFVKMQQWGSSRSQLEPKFLALFEIEQNRNKFGDIYRKLQLPMLHAWAWVGGLNVHRWGIIIFSLFGRFDIFLWIGLASSVGIIIMYFLQLEADKKIIAKFHK